MSNWIILAFLAVAGWVAAVWLTGVFRSYALRAQLVDAVNARGAHAVATPRGGGAAIVITALCGFACAAGGYGSPVGTTVGLAGGGAAVAAIGWLDDHGHVAARYRLAVHAVAAAWAVLWIGAFPLELVPYWPAEWRLPAQVLSVLLGIWLINLYNFMDGIDGLAASEAASINVGGSIMLVMLGAGPLQVAAPAVLAAACLGFLRWNWPPARVFMGDASSGFLGFCVFALVLSAGTFSAPLAISWLALAGVFLADATITLLMRLSRGERVYEAHRSHAYQRLSRRAGRHLPVTIGAIAITWLWLFPIALAIASAAIDPIAGLAVALVPLFVAAMVLGAGRPDKVYD